jgi:hypothetical protein
MSGFGRTFAAVKRYEKQLNAAEPQAEFRQNGPWGKAREFRSGGARAGAGVAERTVRQRSRGGHGAVHGVDLV